jgi:uncharacterized membrane protein YidH (DUF202 family)
VTDPDDPAVPGPDPALATERTALAWTRTALTCAGLAAVSLRLLDRNAAVLVVLAFAVAVALPGVTASWWRLRDLRDGPPGPPPGWVVALLAGTVVLVDVAVLVRLLTRL